MPLSRWQGYKLHWPNSVQYASTSRWRSQRHLSWQPEARHVRHWNSQQAALRTVKRDTKRWSSIRLCKPPDVQTRLVFSSQYLAELLGPWLAAFACDLNLPQQPALRMCAAPARSTAVRCLIRSRRTPLRCGLPQASLAVSDQSAGLAH